MKTIHIYTPGVGPREIIRTIRTTPNQFSAQCGENEVYIIDNSNINFDNDVYVLEGVLKLRTIHPAVIDKQTVIADLIDECSIANISQNTEIFINNESYGIIGEEYVDLSFEKTGIFEVLLKNTIHKDLYFTIEAI